MRDETSTTDSGWIESPAVLAERIAELGRKHELTEALLRRAVSELESYFWSQPSMWRFNFQDPLWNKRRRGDGRLGGDWMDGGWGPLSREIDQDTWIADLAWARPIRDAEIIGSFLGLHLPPRGFSLWRLPNKARLELWPRVVEPTLLQWAPPAAEQPRQPLPPMNLHLHTTVPGESERSAASESSDPATDLGVILPAAGRPTQKDLILLEMHRRKVRNELADGIAEEARQLRQWLANKYPTVTPPTVESIENAIREDYWSLKA